MKGTESQWGPHGPGVSRALSSVPMCWAGLRKGGGQPRQGNNGSGWGGNQCRSFEEWTGWWADSFSGLLRNSAWKEKVGRTHELPSPEEGLLEGRFQAGENRDSMEMRGNGSCAVPGGVGT